MTQPWRPTVAVFGASSAAPGDGHFEDARELGRLLADAGYAVATGGYGGLMEAVSEGAASAGGHVIGVTAPAVFRSREGANVHVTEELRAASLTERIHDMIDLSDAAIALHGSLGTATELMVAWNLAFVARFSHEDPDPVVAVGATWRRMINDLGEILETDTSVITCVDTVADAVAFISRRLG